MILLALLFVFADARALFERGLQQQKTGDLTSAEASFAEAADIDPRNFAVLGNLGVVRAQLGNFAGALEAYHRALGLNPAAHRLHLNIAIAHFKMSQFEEALRRLDIFLQHVPDEPQAEELRALSLYQVQRYSDSQAALERLIGTGGEKLSYLYALGQAQIKTGRRDAAEATFRRMFTLYPDAAEAHLLQAQALMGDNQHEAAMESLERAQRRNSKLPGIGLWKGIALEGLGKPEEALAAYHAEIRLSGDLLAYYAAGILESRDGNAARAEDLLERALPIDSERYNVSYYLGRVYRKLGRYEDALRYIRRSLERNPDSTSERYALIEVYTKMGRMKEAADEAAAIRRLHDHALEQDSGALNKVKTGTSTPPR